MGTKEIETLLAKSGLRPSPSKILILKTIIEARQPLSALDIENRLQTIDRSSITRTLPLLSEAHLIHKIPDGSGSMKYEKCNSHEERVHQDEHAHFYCRVCGQTSCFADMEIKSPKLPEGYIGENLSFIITGICPDCSAKK